MAFCPYFTIGLAFSMIVLIITKKSQKELKSELWIHYSHENCTHTTEISPFKNLYDGGK
jgi:hypothetical protein